MIEGTRSMSERVRLSTLQYGQRPTSTRRGRTISVLPQYNPDAEAEEVNRKHKKKVKFWVLFRYASWLDISLMSIGIIAAVLCAICLPYLIYRHGKIIHIALEDERCFKILGNTSTHAVPGGSFSNASSRRSSVPLNGQIDWRHDSSGTGHVHNANMTYSPSIPHAIKPWFNITMSVFATNLVTCFVYVACFSIAAENQINRLRIAYFESLLRKDMSWLDNYVEREFGKHMTHDITQLRSGIGEKFCYIIFVIVAIVALLGVAFFEEWKLALITVILGPVAIGVGYLSSRAENLEADHFETSNVKSGIVAEEAFANIRTVKVYEGEEKETTKYASALQPKSGWKWFIISISNGAAGFFMFLTYSIVFYFGSGVVWDTVENAENCRPSHAHHVNEGPDQLFVVFYCILFASLHSLELPTLVSQMKAAVDVASDVFFMIDWKPRIDNMSRRGDLPDSGVIGKIEFENVNFRYPRKPGISALHHLSMTIYPGQVIAFVGSLGCGKSTILRLILRLYDPTSGNIFLDGHNIENLNIRWLRSHLALVSQEPVLFNRSVEDNVRYAKRKATIADIHQACKKAGIHDDIMQLKRGYKTIVGPHGNLLSTSQKRQLSFARAYLQQPKVLLLDDPVAGCVPEFENLVLQAITQMRDKTTIVLASTIVHSIVQNADRIYVMDKGTIVERGNHDFLMSLNGAYVEIRNRMNNNEQNSKYISQLTSYRFAQSLRRMHLRKARALHESQRKLNEAKKPRSANESGSTQDMVSHPRRTNQALVLRVAGGLQRYNYTRTQVDPSLHLRRNLGRGVSKIQEERGLKQRDVWGRNREEMSSQFFQQMQKHRESFSAQFDVALQGARPRADSIMSNTSAVRFNVNTRRGSLDSETLSIASDDSLMFWADYENLLDNLEDVHSVTSWRDMLKLGVQQRKWVLASIITSLLAGLTPPWYGWITAEIFGTFAFEERKNGLGSTTWYCIQLVFLAVASGVVTFLQEYVFSHGGYRMMKDLRVKLFSHILSQDQEWFDKPENDISFLCARLSMDVSLVENILIISSGVISQCIATFITAFMICILTIPCNKVIVIYGLFMGLATLVIVYADGWLQKEWDWITDIRTLDDATEIEIDVISNIRTVIYLGLERQFLDEFKTEIRKSRKKLFLANLLRSILFGLAYALPFGFFSIIVYVYMTSYYAHDGKQRFVDMLKLTELLIFGLIPLGTSLALLPNTKICLGAAFRINRIFNSKPRLEQRPPNAPPLIQQDFPFAPKVELMNVAFNFNLNIEYSILRDISFSADRLHTVAIVGPEGCGKSSVIQLLLRLYEPFSGIITIDDVDLSKMDMKCTRRITAFVEQNPSIFDCTIRENIAYGDNSRHVTMNEIIEAAKLACVHDDISELAYGYETQISSLDSFQNSSFGLRQRIVFARAIVRDPKLLVIDEATASVDPDSDFILLRALDSCCYGRTTIIASQRIEPIRNADLIIVLTNGLVVESGQDRELLEAKGVYFNMYMAQREAEGLSTDINEVLEEEEETVETSEQPEEKEKNEGAHRRSTLSDKSGSYNTQGRRKSSIDYMNYLKRRLRYMPRQHSLQSINPSMMSMSLISSFTKPSDQVFHDSTLSPSSSRDNRNSASDENKKSSNK